MRLLSDMQSCGRKAAASDESAESGVKLHRGRIGVEEFAIDSGSGSGRFCDLGPRLSPSCAVHLRVVGDVSSLVVGNFRLNHERRLVAQIFTRWNRVADWLRETEHFSTAASVRIPPSPPQ